MHYLRLIIISSSLMLPAITIGAEFLRSAEQLAIQYQAAYNAGDYSGIEDLIYWEDVDQKLRKIPRIK